MRATVRYCRVAHDFATVTVRYGQPSWMRSIVAVEAMRNRYPANFFETRTEAIHFLTQSAQTALRWIGTKHTD